jgi:hypothetical protein
MTSANQRRWARHARNWQPIAAVALNPERESMANAEPPKGKKARTAANNQAATSLT